jgi:hypothetical protein
MSFNYDVMTEEEAMNERYQLLKDGEYDAVITSVTEKTSSTGNYMFEVILDVYDELGRTFQVKDFWVFTRSMMWKVIHGCKSAGIFQEYNDKKLTTHLLMHKNVRIVIATQAGSLIPEDKLNGKPAGSRYPNKNVVNDYVMRKAGIPMQKASNDFNDDDIPF